MAMLCSMLLLKNRDKVETWTQLEVMMIIIRRSYCRVSNKRMLVKQDHEPAVRINDREPINQYLGLNPQKEPDDENPIPPLLGSELRSAAI